MSVALSRTAFRRVLAHQPHNSIIFRARPQSTTATAQQTASNVAQTAKETIAPAANKAQEGLSRVVSSAGGAATAVGNAVGSVGGPIGRLVGFVQGLIPPTIYYSRVGLELGKIIFESRKMSPPSMQTFQSFFNSAMSSLQNPSSLVRPLNPVTYFRNLDQKSLAAGGVILAEVIGFFTVGEMIGRLKIVGYRGGSHHEEGEH